MDSELVFGEFKRTLDERFRVSIPHELLEKFDNQNQEWILTKESPGSLSLWDPDGWQEELDEGIDLVARKLKAQKLSRRDRQVQLLGRLLSTRHRKVQIKNKSRLSIPEGFREFLGVEPNGELLIVGAAVCVEIWRFDAWIQHLEVNMPEFNALFGKLSS